MTRMMIVETVETNERLIGDPFGVSLERVGVCKLVLLSDFSQWVSFPILINGTQ